MSDYLEPPGVAGYTDGPPPGADEFDTGPPPAASAPKPFDWHLVDAGDVWTDDPDRIAALSDPPIVEGLLREREVAAVIGAAKTSKTWFALGLALAVAAGDPFLGMETTRRKVLYLDYELKPGTFAKRLSLLADHRPEGFAFQCLRGCPDLPTVADIAELAIREGFGLVVVDSLYRTGWIREENNNDTTSRDLTDLQSFTRNAAGASMLVVDHTGKGGGEGKSAVDAGRGASAKGGFFDSLIVLRPTDKGPDPVGNYAILDPVLRDWPRWQELPLVSFQWDTVSCHISTAGTVAPGETSTTNTAVLEALATAEAGLSRAAVVALVGGGEWAVRRSLTALVAKGLVVEAPDPKHKQRLIYRLADMADETAKNHCKP